MHSSWTQHLDAFLLAVASSTDNFTVGLSVGISNGGEKYQFGSLPEWVNAVISFSNAFGAFIAGFGGMWLSHIVPSYVAPLLAAIAFGILAIQEYYQSKQAHQHLQQSDDNRKSSSSQQQKSSSSKGWNITEVIQLALPMTLNNLAGGVAGGAAGLSPFMSASYALIA